MDVDARRAAFECSSMRRAKLPALKRNAAVVLGNVGAVEDVPMPRHSCDDREPHVRGEHAAGARAARRLRPFDAAARPEHVVGTALDAAECEPPRGDALTHDVEPGRRPHPPDRHRRGAHRSGSSITSSTYHQPQPSPDSKLRMIGCRVCRK